MIQNGRVSASKQGLFSVHPQHRLIQYGINILNPLTGVGWIILHEGHDHASERSGIEWMSILGVLFFLIIVGSETWYIYKRKNI